MSPASPQFRVSELITILARLVQAANGQGDNAARRLLIVSDDVAVAPNREHLVRTSPERTEVIGVDINQSLAPDLIASIQAFMTCVRDELKARGVRSVELEALLSNLDSLNRLSLLSPDMARRLLAALNSPAVQSVLQQAEMRFARERSDLHARLSTSNNPNTPEGGRLLLVRVRRFVLGRESGTGTVRITHRHVVQGTESQAKLTVREQLEVFRRGEQLLHQAERQRPQSLRDVFARLSRRPVTESAEPASTPGLSADYILHTSAYEQALSSARSIAEGLAAEVAAARVVEGHIFGEPATDVVPLSKDELSALEQMRSVIYSGTISDALALERVMVSTAAKIQAGQAVSEEAFVGAVQEALRDRELEFSQATLDYLRDVYRHIAQHPGEYTEEGMPLLSQIGNRFWRADLATDILSMRYHPLVVYRVLKDPSRSDASYAAEFIEALVDQSESARWIEQEVAFLSRLVTAGSFEHEQRLPSLPSIEAGDPGRHPVLELQDWDDDVAWSVHRLLFGQSVTLRGPEGEVLERGSNLIHYLEPDKLRTLMLYLSGREGWYRFRELGGNDILSADSILARLLHTSDMFGQMFEDGEDLFVASLAMDRALLETLMLRRDNRVPTPEEIRAIVEFNLRRFGVTAVDDISDVVELLTHVDYLPHYRYGVSEFMLYPDRLLDLLRRANHPSVAMAYMLLHGASYDEARLDVADAAGAYRYDAVEMQRLLSARMQFVTRLAGGDAADTQAELDTVLRTLISSIRDDDMDWRLSVLLHLANRVDVDLPDEVRRLISMPVPDVPDATRYTGRVVVLLPGDSGFRAFHANVQDMPLTPLPFDIEPQRDPLHPHHLAEQEEALQRLMAHVLSGHPVVLPEEQFTRLLMSARGVEQLYEAFQSVASASPIESPGSYASGRHAVHSAAIERARNLLEFWFEAGDFDESDIEQEDPYEVAAERVASWREALGITDDVVFRRRIGRGRSERVLRSGGGGIRRDVEPEMLLTYRAEEAANRARALQAAMERLERRGEYAAVGPGGRLLQVLGLDVVDETGGVPVFRDRLRVREWTLDEFLRTLAGEDYVVSPMPQGAMVNIVAPAEELATHLVRRANIAHVLPDAERFVPMFWSVEDVMSTLASEHRHIIGLAADVERELSEMTDGEVHLRYGDLYRSLMMYRRQVSDPWRFAALEDRVRSAERLVDAMLAQSLSDYMDLLNPEDLRALRSYVLAGLPRYEQEGVSFTGLMFNRFLTGLVARRIGGVNIAEPGFLNELSRSVSEQLMSEYGSRSDLVLLHSYAARLADQLGLPRERAIMQALYRFVYKSVAYHANARLRIDDRVFEDLSGAPRDYLDIEVALLREHGTSVRPDVATQAYISVIDNSGQLSLFPEWNLPQASFESIITLPRSDPPFPDRQMVLPLFGDEAHTLPGGQDAPRTSYWSGHEEMLESLGFSAPEGLFGARRRRFMTVFGWQSEMDSAARQPRPGQAEEFERLLERAFGGEILPRERKQLNMLLDMFGQYAVDRETLEAYERRGVYDPSYFPVARALYHIISSDADTRLSVALRRAYLGTAGARASDLETLQDLGAAAFAFAAEFVRSTPPGARISELGGAIMPSDPDEVAEFLHQNLLRLMIAHALRGASREQVAWEASMRSLDESVSSDDGDSRTLLDMAVQSLTMHGDVAPTPQDVVASMLEPGSAVTSTDEPQRPSRFAEMMERFDVLSAQLQKHALREPSRRMRVEEALVAAADAIVGSGLVGKTNKQQKVRTQLSELNDDDINRLSESLAVLQDRMSKRDIAAALRHFKRKRPRPPMNYMSSRVQRAMDRAEQETGNPQLWRDYYTVEDAKSETVQDFLRWVLGDEQYQQLIGVARERAALIERLNGLVSDIKKAVAEEGEWVNNELNRLNEAVESGKITDEQRKEFVKGTEIYLKYVNAEARRIQEIDDYLKRSRVESDFEVWLQGELDRIANLRSVRQWVIKEQGYNFVDADDVLAELRSESNVGTGPRSSSIPSPIEPPERHDLSIDARAYSNRYTLGYLRAISDVLTDLSEGRIQADEASGLLRGLRLVSAGGSHAVSLPLWLNDEQLDVTVLPGRRVSVAGRVLSLDEGEPYTITPEAVQAVPQQIERPVDLSQAAAAQVILQPDDEGGLRPAVRLVDAVGGIQTDSAGAEPVRYMALDIETDPNTGRLLQAGVITYTYTGEGSDIDRQSTKLFLSSAEVEAGIPVDATKAFRQLEAFIEDLSRTYNDKSVLARRIAESLAVDAGTIFHAVTSAPDAYSAAMQIIRSGLLSPEVQAIRQLAEHLIAQVESGAVPVVQNVAFDVPFLVARLEELGESDLAGRLRSTLGVQNMIDVAEMAVRAGHAQVNLQALGRETGVLGASEREAHLALEDAVLAARVAGRLQQQIDEAGQPLPVDDGRYLVGLGPGRLFDISGPVAEQVIGLRDRVFRVVGAGYSTEQNRVSVELEELAFDENGQPVPLRRLRFEPMMGDQDVHPMWQASLEMGRMFTAVDEAEARRVYELSMHDAFRREIERILSPDLPPDMTVRPGELPSQYEREGIITSMMTVLRARAIAEGLPENFSDAADIAAWVRETLGMGEALPDELAVHLGQRAAYYLTLQYARDPRRQEVYRRVWQWWTDEDRQRVLGETLEQVIGRGLESQLSWADITWVWRNLTSRQIEEAGLQPEPVEVPAYRQNMMHLNLARPRGGFATVAVPTDLPEATQEAMILHRVRTQLRRQLLEGAIGEGEAMSSARADLMSLLAMSEGDVDADVIQATLRAMAERRLIALQLRDIAQRLETVDETTPDALRLEALQEQLLSRSVELAREIDRLASPYEGRISELMRMRPLQIQAELGRNAVLRELLDEYILRVALPVDTTAAEMSESGVSDAAWNMPDIGTSRAMDALSSVLRRPPPGQTERVPVERLVPHEVSDEEFSRLWQSVVRQSRASRAAQRIQQMLHDIGVSDYRVTLGDLSTGVPMHSAVVALHQVLSEAADQGEALSLSDVTARMRQLLGADELTIGRYHTLNLQNPNAAYEFVQYLMRSAGWIRRYSDLIDEDWLSWANEQLHRMYRLEAGRARAFAQTPHPSYIEAPVTTPFPEEYMDWVAQAWNELNAGLSDVATEGASQTGRTAGEASTAEASAAEASAGISNLLFGSSTTEGDRLAGATIRALLAGFADDLLIGAIALGGYLWYRRRRRREDDDESDGSVRVHRRASRGTAVAGSTRFVVQANPFHVQPGHHVRFDSDYRMPSQYRLRRMERDMEGLL